MRDVQGGCCLDGVEGADGLTPMHRTGVLRKNLSVHLLGLLLFCGCAAATWWQVGRALGGNGLSWAYVVEWPFFAGYSLFMWVKLLREGEPPRTHSPTYERWLGTPPPAPEEEQREAERLWAYNRYLAELTSADQAGQLGLGRRQVGFGRRQVGSGRRQVASGRGRAMAADPTDQAGQRGEPMTGQ